MSVTETPRQETATLRNGRTVVLAGTGKVLGAFGVDIAVIGGAAVLAYFISSRTSYSEWQPLLVALATWFFGSAVYGFLFFTGRTLGCLAAGSAFVRNSDGGWPGPFRMAWVSFQHYVLIIVLLFGIIASGGAGTSGKTKRERIFHRHIDLAGTDALRG